ncbi:cartilage matrix protein-like [Ruditapes philippinarum]|uniref:cartilage matrix protein-like n=1 Tax=Ruditapes philippinarum TaxID=129788 RepID=UPI00295BB7BC|nr:cartilage matrix protein-like [Ruditapes philippinarum]
MQTFDIGPDSIQVSAVTFSRDARTEFNFNDVDNTQEAQARIGKIRHAQGDATFTNKALERMRTNIFSSSNGARSGVRKLAILLTDGRSTYRTGTLKEAKLAKDAGITILAIGVGKDVDESELRAVVSSPSDKYYFHSSTFDKLKDLLMYQVIGKVACGGELITPRPTTTEGQDDRPDPDTTCQGKNADVMFVVDMSSSIWSVHFKQQLQFLADITSFFDIGKTRVGMITFSNNSVVQFYLDQYSTQEDIRRAILSVQTLGGLTYTNLALKTTRYEMFSAEHGSRRDVAHICMVITDGVSRYPRQTAVEASLLHQAGIDVFAIGVGDEIDVNELHAIASKPQYVFEVNGYGALKQFEEILAVRACETPKVTTPAPDPQNPEVLCRGKKKDVIFAVDMSNSIWEVDFDTQLKFLSDLVDVFDINSGNTRVGLLTFSTGTQVNFYLNNYANVDDVKNAILAAKQKGGLQTNTHLALKEVQNDLLSFEHGARKGVDRVVIVITDGVSRQQKLTASQADMLHQEGVEVIAIGVGKKIDVVELSNIASRPEYMFDVNGGYSTLKDISNILARKTCEVVY